ncbi:MAG: hypothetical protein M3Z92_07425 [Bacteroidota bacterium]|nr:hypothetical protein [Bacteroidota bacterium]MDQ6888770.1 hypothetical protein [Bacteroidota bacterium]
MRATVICLAFFFAFFKCFSQKVDPGSSAKVVYGEVLSVSGPTVFTGNFDIRFRGQKGFGAHGGLGILGSGGGGSILVIPLGVNYLAGKAPHYFEGGLGTTILTITNNAYFRESIAVVVPSAGYRYQPASNGISVRVFVSPWVVLQGGVVFAGGLSLGYKF